VEAADHRRVEVALADRRGPPDSPEAGLGLDQSEREPLEVRSARKVGCLERVDVSEAAEDRTRLALGLELHPIGVALDEWLDSLSVCLPPAAEEEVEIVAGVVGTHRSYRLVPHGAPRSRVTPGR
jgi:hypothetical protein